MGVEYAEGEDYTLTYYQVVDGVDGEPVEVEIAPENIKDVGTYNVVATPTRNGVLSGEAWATFTVAEEPPKLIGDINHDGIVDILDATVVQKYAAEQMELDKTQLYVGDVNDDGVVDILDATDIQKFATEKLTEFKKKA
jgi:hypothetical protein